jgi:orotate phosphoribosyltransferase
MQSMQEEIVRRLPIRKGHFRLESGHHGDIWIDLELLCLDLQPIQRFSREIAARLAVHDIEIVCGPLVEGAFVALLAAAELNAPFCYSERIESAHERNRAVEPASSETETNSDTLYPVTYRIPRALRPRVRGKRVAVVNDVINAGSAVRGTVADLAECGAQPVVVAALLVLGSWASEYTSAQNLALETLASIPNTFWAPSDCPLCRANIPITT